MSHNDPQLKYADCVSLTLSRQKKEERMDTVTQMFSRDAIMCPVRQVAALVRRIRSYLGATDDIPMLAVWRNNRIEHLTSAKMTEGL